MRKTTKSPGEKIVDDPIHVLTRHRTESHEFPIKVTVGINLSKEGLPAVCADGLLHVWTQYQRDEREGLDCH